MEKLDSIKTPLHYLDVAPRLTINGEFLPLDALAVFSVIHKFMGQYPSGWNEHLGGIAQRNYNMIHFCPMMQRGHSNSPYSIYDQLTFDPQCFKNGEKDVAELVSRMEKDFGLLSLTDVVWNHTANNSKWLEDHPEAGYSVATAPWLQAALELDDALLQFGKELDKHGYSSTIEETSDLLTLLDGIKKHVVSEIRLWEYYIVDVDRDADAAVDAWLGGKVKFPPQGFGAGGISNVKNWPIKQKADILLDNGILGAEHLGGRYTRHVDPAVTAGLLTALLGRHSESGRSASEGAVRNEAVKILDELNLNFYKEYDSDVQEILEQLFNRIKYIRLDDNGPKIKKIDDNSPIIETYFTRLPLNDVTKKHDPKALSLVNNGWVWNADASIDIAGSSSRAYLRREVIAWGDCVKMRYGQTPKDNPYLWEHMTKYTQLMAKYFGAFRIDNCHSTPLPVAEYMLDEARKVRPNLAVFAELFTGSEEMDYVFVKRLGISSLIREAMQAWSTAELSRLVHRHGGRPIGSFDMDILPVTEPTPAVDECSEGKKSEEQMTRRIRLVRESPVHALFFDCTHDNEVPAQKRTGQDTLPNAALISFCGCATGSVMGYDEIYPRLVNLVSETRLYTSPYSKGSTEIRTGIGGLKKILNKMHVDMGVAGYDESHVHHENTFVTVHRAHPETRQGYFLIANTAFPGAIDHQPPLAPTHLAGTSAELLGAWSLSVDASNEAVKVATENPKELVGLPSNLRDVKGVTCEVGDDGARITVPTDFTPGSIALFKTWVPGAQSGRREFTHHLIAAGAEAAVADLDLIDLNFILYRCDAEERDLSEGADGVYTIPNHGPLVYAGLQGWWSLLEVIMQKDDLGHPLCNHLRTGQWALNYTSQRMFKLSQKLGRDGIKSYTDWIISRIGAIRKIPSFLTPRYFAFVIQTAYMAAYNRAMKMFAPTITEGNAFLKRLAMVSVQQKGLVRSTSLYPTKDVPCLAAGLPHFAVEWSRCWGRDVFISLRGLLLATGRHENAKEHILAFASVLKHGMIPNLLDAGRKPRYNSRDSVWFWLQAVQDYVIIVAGGVGILKEKVERRFMPYDDTYFDFDDPRAYSKTSTVEEVINEVMQRHAEGISFREANAGPGLDMQMSSEGFNIDIKVDWSSGLIFGGNQHNCGTWMDKMGESERAGSKGIPGTPRDGAAIEITGLLYSALAWLTKLHREGSFAGEGVKVGGKTITYDSWAEKVRNNFNKAYYIPVDEKDDSHYDVNPKIVARRGIYKDLYRSGIEFEDYQFRPNFAIAMCAAPELFDPKQALGVLILADEVLRGPTGMATLDPKDLNYRPYYNNSEDSTDFATSKGRNYHQGPEWLWPTGYFLRALLKFDLMRRTTKEGRAEAFQQITRRLEGCKKAISESPWKGLTELTQKNGEYCPDSSPTQAWSAGCLIDLYMDANQLSKELL